MTTSTPPPSKTITTTAAAKIPAPVTSRHLYLLSTCLFHTKLGPRAKLANTHTFTNYLIWGLYPLHLVSRNNFSSMTTWRGNKYRHIKSYLHNKQTTNHHHYHHHHHHHHHQQQQQQQQRLTKGRCNEMTVHITAVQNDHSICPTHSWCCQDKELCGDNNFDGFQPEW